jgi:hypothetical protein
LSGGGVTVRKEFSEEVKIDGIILSWRMPGEDLFESLEKIAQDHGIESGADPFSRCHRFDGPSDEVSGKY